MIPLGGRPLLEHQVELARKHGFNRIVLLICYRADRIEEHFGDGSKWGVSISYVVESEPLGTAGAVLAAWHGLENDFLVLYGDVLVNVNLEKLWTRHLESHADA